MYGIENDLLKMILRINNLRLCKYPRNPQKFLSLKISCPIVHKLLRLAIIQIVLTSGYRILSVAIFLVPVNYIQFHLVATYIS